MDEMLFVFLVALVTLGGVIIGAKVQKVCRFIIPDDFLTVLIILGIAVYILFSPVKVEWYWFGSFLVGYFCGYLIVGRTTYTMCIEMPDPDHIRVCNRVFYEDSGKTYVQVQSNRALFDRLVFRIQHEVDSNVPLGDDKVLSYDRPLFPTWEDRAILIERIYDTVDEKDTRVFHHKIYTTHIEVAYGSSTSKMQLMYDIDVLRQMQYQIIDLTSEVHRLQGETGPKMLEHAMQLDMAAKQTTPENRALSLAKALKIAKASIPMKGETEDDE